LRPVYIPDEEVEADFAVLHLKKRWGPGKRLKYFLAKLERQLGGADVSDATMSATVEHIAPGPNSGVHLKGAEGEGGARRVEAEGEAGDWVLCWVIENGQISRSRMPRAQSWASWLSGAVGMVGHMATWLGCRLRRNRIHLSHLEADADDGTADLFFAIVRIGRGDDGVVGQQMDAWVEAVFEGLQEAHAILAGLALLDVVVSADPGDEAILAGGLLGS
jgi:hypothetical protein